LKRITSISPLGKALAKFSLIGLSLLGTNNAVAQTEGVRRQAGLWQQTQTLLAIETPQAPQAIATAARANIGRPIVSERVCVPATSVSRDTLASRLSVIMPDAPNFHWTRLDLQASVVTALGIDLHGSLTVEGKITPILTEVIATSQTNDPIVGRARRVQRTLIIRLGPC
jgi:hypothetical protein